MLSLEIKEVVRAVGGVLRQGFEDIPVKGVSTDSRTARCGDIFFALKGPNFDAHDFLKDVASKGVLGAVVEKDGAKGLPKDFALIQVKDTVRALGDLAGYYRSKFSVPVVAVTGSAGKTTTKEMIASILSRSRKVLKTEGNKNNLIGLPQTLFGLDVSHRAAVVELGISEVWEMERLAGICSPDVAVITNIGRSHLQSLGSIEGVMEAKGPLFTKLKPGGVKAVNLDDDRVASLAKGSKDIVTYSVKTKADVTLKEYKAEGFDRLRAVYGVTGKKAEAVFSTPGVSNLINGAAAIAAVIPLEASISEIEEGLANFSPVKGRMAVIKTGGITVLDDTYNANPESMASSLQTLKEAAGRKVAVMGEMLELGEASRSEHRKIGKLAAELGIEMVFAIGARAADVVEGALEAGLGTRSIFGFETKKEAVAALKETLRDGDFVLVKGSRGVALEEVVEAISGPKEARQAR